MTDLMQQLENYGQHFDRAIGHGEPPARPVDHVVQFEPDEGDLTMVEVQTRTPATDHPADISRRKWRHYAVPAVSAAAAVILVVVAFALFDDPEQGSLDVVDSPVTETAPELVEETGPASIIETYRETFNSGDLDGVMALFTEDSVVEFHPFSTDSPFVRGLERIRELQSDYIDAGATEDAYTISDVEASDDTVTWTSRWVDRFGNESCHSGQTAVIGDDKIVSWTWAGSFTDCP